MPDLLEEAKRLSEARFLDARCVGLLTDDAVRARRVLAELVERLERAELHEAQYVALLDTLEQVMFGSVQRRSNDDLVERVEALAAQQREDDG